MKSEKKNTILKEKLSASDEARTKKKQSRLLYAPRLAEEVSGEFYDAAYAAYEAGFPADDASIARQTRVLDVAAEKSRMTRREAIAQGRTEMADKLAFNDAALLLLRDLVQMGWTLCIQGHHIELQQKPLSQNRTVAKQQIRDSMSFERRDSMSGSAVRDFVRDMERVRYVDGEERSIFSLIADGERLHELLSTAATLPNPQKTDFLQTGVCPYLQIVEGDGRDEFTSLRLIDIWRYFRLTWSTPYRHTPGRKIFYLVRDRGQPNHPVIGIAALSNCIIGIRCRDDKIGWTPDALADKLVIAKAQDQSSGVDSQVNLKRVTKEIASMLEAHLESGIAAISIEDITTRNEVTYPSEEGIAAIWRIAEDATEARYKHLQKEALVAALDPEVAALDPEEFELQAPDAGNPKQVTRGLRDSSTALFRRKRASKLGSLLQAKLLCREKNALDNPTVGIPALLWGDREWQVKNEAGRSCLRTILNANKDSRIGSSMMEITVCGAVAPYNMLLGGKLVAMLLTSPQVVQDYEVRYGDQASTIASQVAGYEVKRDARLVYLGTSSLYADAGDKAKNEDGKTDTTGKRTRYSSASQYNRVRIPASILGGSGEVKYECLGMTEGYGVVHFAADTREALEELDIITHQAKRVNSLFGEGMSPRLRKIRQGISLLGLSDEFLVHGQKRLVYAISLAHNSDRYLTGIDNVPRYIFPLFDDPGSASDKIGRYWIERWLAMRVSEPGTMLKLAAFDPQTSAVSRELGMDSQSIPSDLGL